LNLKIQEKFNKCIRNKNKCLTSSVKLNYLDSVPFKTVLFIFQEQIVSVQLSMFFYSFESYCFGFKSFQVQLFFSLSDRFFSSSGFFAGI